MRSSSLMTKLPLVCAAALAAAVGCKTSSSSSNMGATGAEMADAGSTAAGGMMDAGMSGMESTADAGMSSAQSGMNTGAAAAGGAAGAGATTAAEAAQSASDAGMYAMGSMADAGASAMGSTADAGSTTLSDAQIAGVTAAAHKGEIQAAQLARKQSKNSHVKSFASQMIKQHTNAQKMEAQLGAKAGITPADSDLSSQVTQDSADAASKLQGLSGKEFDKAYAQGQVDAHQKVLDTLDNTLIPSAQNPDLKALLQKERGVVATHLEHAKKLNDSLSQ
jgi:putative membrane protein